MIPIILNEEQAAAIEEIKKWGNGDGPALISLTGGAGTGKTSIVIEAKKYIKNSHYCALTGRAALRLSEAAGVMATTLHSILYKRPEQLNSGEIAFKTLAAPSFKYLIIDESSLITPKIFDDLNKWVYFYGIRILFVGDWFQLPPILSEAERKNNNNFMVFLYVNGPELKTVMRSNDDIISIATIIREEKRFPLESNSSYSLIQVPDPIEYTIDEYLSDPNDHMVITWTNKMRMQANHNVRRKLGHTQYLPDEGEPIIFGRNGQGVLNGQIAIVKKIVAGPIIEGILTYRILLEDKKYILCSVIGGDERMDGQSPKILNWKNYLKARKKHNVEDPIPITYGYVSTCHRSQGNEWRRVSVMLEGNDINNPYFRQQTILPNGVSMPFGIRFLYTGLTRAKEKTMLVVGT